MLGELLQGALSMTPGYIQGRQQAIKDNWSDLNQFNQVRAGQLGNLFNEATFDDRWNVGRNQRLLSDDQAQLSANNLVLNNIDTMNGVRTRFAQSPYVEPLAVQNAQNAFDAAGNVPFNLAMGNMMRAYKFSHPELYYGNLYDPSFLTALQGYNVPEVTQYGYY